MELERALYHRAFAVCLKRRGNCEYGMGCPPLGLCGPLGLSKRIMDMGSYDDVEPDHDRAFLVVEQKNCTMAN